MNIYRIKSDWPVEGKNKIKTIHAILSYLFESSLENWKKGDEYPPFKIRNCIGKTIILVTKENLIERTFSYNFCQGENCVSIQKIGKEAIREITNGKELYIYGDVSLRKNLTRGGRENWVWSKYGLGSVKDMTLFKNKICDLTGVMPKQNLTIEPIYIHKDCVSNEKMIWSAFSIGFFGEVVDSKKAEKLQYAAIGQDRGYGFGALEMIDA